MGNCENALRQAVASGNEQLCLALLLHLKRHQYSNDDAGYMRLLDRVPQAHSYLLTLRRQQSGDGQKLFQLLLREPRDNNGIDGASDWDETPTSAPTSPSSAVSSEAAVERFRDAGDLMLAMAAAAKDPRERLSYLEKALAAFTHPDVRFSMPVLVATPFSHIAPCFLCRHLLSWRDPLLSLKKPWGLHRSISQNCHRTWHN